LDVAFPCDSNLHPPTTILAQRSGFQANSTFVQFLFPLMWLRADRPYCRWQQRRKRSTTMIMGMTGKTTPPIKTAATRVNPRYGRSHGGEVLLEANDPTQADICSSNGYLAAVFPVPSCRGATHSAVSKYGVVCRQRCRFPKFLYDKRK
jgi:hypothetical protein